MFTKFNYAFVGLLMTSASLAGCQSMNGNHNTLPILTFKAPTLTCHAAMKCNIVGIDGVRTAASTVQLTSTTLSAGAHEIEVEFDPSTKNHPERFKFTHDFVRGHEYELAIYRELKDDDNSLLAAALPGKLCIKLLNENRIIRQFCRNIEDVKRNNQFSEQHQSKTVS